MKSVPTDRATPTRRKVKKSLALLGLLLVAAAQACGGGGRPEAAQRQNASAEANRPAQKRREVSVKVVENEPTLRGAQSVIGGSVENVSGDRLEALSLSLELTRRGDGAKELREVSVSPATLGAGEAGRYSITVSNRDWSGTRIVAVRSGAGSDTLAFVTEPGAKRPPERIPEGGRTVVVQKPRPKGEEFLNSPDDPEPIR